MARVLCSGHAVCTLWLKSSWTHRYQKNDFPARERRPAGKHECWVECHQLYSHLDMSVITAGRWKLNLFLKMISEEIDGCLDTVNMEERYSEYNNFMFNQRWLRLKIDFFGLYFPFYHGLQLPKCFNNASTWTLFTFSSLFVKQRFHIMMHIMSQKGTQ